MMRVLMLAAAALALTACGEEPQTLESATQDTTSFSGTPMPYVAKGWKEGDKASWEQHLKVRAQTTQNEYTRVN